MNHYLTRLLSLVALLACLLLTSCYDKWVADQQQTHADRDNRKAGMRLGDVNNAFGAAPYQINFNKYGDGGTYYLRPDQAGGEPESHNFEFIEDNGTYVIEVDGEEKDLEVEKLADGSWRARFANLPRGKDIWIHYQEKD